MSINTSELYLLIRLRDEASRGFSRLSGVIKNFDKDWKNSIKTAQSFDDKMRIIQNRFATGALIATGGAAIAGLGILSAKTFYNMAQDAADYSETVGKTLTQVDNRSIFTHEKIAEMGKRIATTYGVSFDEIQASMYDLFSSMEVDSEAAASTMMNVIAEAAIGGATDMQTAGRAIIGTLNAWSYSADKAQYVSDVLFKTVKEGIGEYNDFAHAIGKVGPSANLTNQSLETTTGALAFMTRIGFSTAESSTAVARAMDLIARKDVRKRLEDYGVKVTDTNGNFRDMADIMLDLQGKMEGLSDSARSDKMEEIFGKNVRALRFLNSATGDAGVLFQQLVDDMYNAEGAAATAFETMAEEANVKMALMANSFEVFKITVGEVILPIKTVIVDMITKVLNAFNNLSPGMQKFLVVLGLVGTIIMIVVGFALVFIGIFVMVQAVMAAASAAIAAAGGIMSAIIVPVLVVIAVIAALIAIGYLIIENWDAIKAAAAKVWDRIKGPIENIKEVWSNVMDNLKSSWDNFVAGFEPVMEKLIGLWEKLKPVLTVVAGIIGGVLGAAFLVLQAIVLGVVNAIGPVLEGLVKIIEGVITFFSGAIDVIIGIFTGDGQRIQDGFGQIWEGLQLIFDGFVTGFFGGIAAFFVGLWDGLVAGFATADELVGGAISGFFIGIGQWFVDGWNGIVETVTTWWNDMITAVIAGASNLWTNITTWFTNIWASITDIFNSIVSTVQDAISAVFSAIEGPIQIIKAIWKAVWESIKAAFAAVFLVIVGLVTGDTQLIKDTINGFLNKIKSIWTATWTFVKIKLREIWNNIVTFLSNTWNNIKTTASNAWNSFKTTIANAITAAKDAVNTGISRILTWFRELPGKVISAISSLVSMLRSKGTESINGMKSGITNAWSSLISFIRGIPGKIRSALSGAASWLTSTGRNIIQGLINGVRNMAGAISGAIKGVVNGAISSAKSVLGIKSPSRVFAALGNMTGQGLVNGLLGMRSAVSKAGEALADAAIPSAPTEFELGFNSRNSYLGNVPGMGIPNDASSLYGNHVEVNQTINTQEIDPEKQSADLGFLITERLGK